MEKRKIRERKIVYGINTGIHYVKGDGRNKEYIYAQHKHDDYEIRIITKGKGKCFIGDHVLEYCKGDIFFIGRNIPHCSSLYEPHPEEEVPESEVLHFRPDLLPLHLNNLPDYLYINKLLLRGQNGLLFRCPTLYRKVKSICATIDRLEGIKRVIQLLKLLELLGKSRTGGLISRDTFEEQNNIYVTHVSLQKTYDYLYNHLKSPITLEEVAAYVGLNAAALCRSFKQKTGMTIFQFLNKIRIENACKLLIYTELNISQVAYESGFNNMSHFNQQFKNITNQTPSEYRHPIEKL